MQPEKIVVLTGAGGGIGSEAARALALGGARLALVYRDADQGEAARRRLVEESGNESLEVFVADLSSQRQTRRLAAEICARCARVDVLINNAAAVYSERTLSEDGIEMQLAVNHLAPFLLTHLLLDRLGAAGRARVVNVGSRAHFRGAIDLDDLDGARRYSGLAAYNQSKLAMVLFTYELARRLAGTGIAVNCVHPGLVRTDIGYKHSKRVHALLHWLLCRFAIPPSEGARDVLHLAASADVEGVSGAYFSKGRAVRSSKSSYDEDLARRLWEVSAERTGLA